MADKRAVILLSGGLDSATTLAWARSEGWQCLCLTFDYGQRHKIEIDHSRRVAAAIGCEEHIVFPLPLSMWGGSALTDHSIAVPDAGTDDTIPCTYVPGRNLVFLSVAASFAEARRAQAIYIGANAVDYSGYPDCRPEFIKALQHAITTGTKAGVEGSPIALKAPLMHLTKKEIVLKAMALGLDPAITISCYNPAPDGSVCGVCDSCVLRQKGLEEAAAISR